MKKLIFLIMTVLLLAACSDNSKNENAADNNQNPQTNEEATNKDGNEEVADFVEYSTVTNEIGTDYDVKVETDTDEKRIILYEDNNGEKVYKSIYLIKNNILKIIDLKEDRLIFNKFFKGEQ